MARYAPGVPLLLLVAAVLGSEAGPSGKPVTTGVKAGEKAAVLGSEAVPSGKPVATGIKVGAKGSLLPGGVPYVRRQGGVAMTTRRAQAAHSAHRQGGNIRSAHHVVSWLAEEEGDAEAAASEEESWLLKTDDQGFTNLALIFLVTSLVIFGVTALCSLVLALRHDGADDSRPHSSVIYYYILMFMATVSALCYYSMYSEVAVVHKEEGGAPRTLFPAQYIEWAVTSPLLLLALALLGNAPWTSIFASIGCDLIMVACLYVGAFISPEHKFFWWGVGVALLLVLIFILIAELSKAVDDGRVKEQDGVTLRILTYLTCFSLAFFPLVWLIGQEGSASASLTTEVALSSVADVLAKVAFTVTLVVRLPLDGDSYGGKLSSVTAGSGKFESTYV